MVESTSTAHFVSPFRPLISIDWPLGLALEYVEKLPVGICLDHSVESLRLWAQLFKPPGEQSTRKKPWLAFIFEQSIPRPSIGGIHAPEKEGGDDDEEECLILVVETKRSVRPEGRYWSGGAARREEP